MTGCWMRCWSAPGTQAGGLRLTGEGSMLGELVRAVLERALEAELTAHLGYERNDRAGRGGHGNYRNGTIAKTVQTGVGPVPLAVPRDRAGTFEPLLVPKRAGRVAGGLDDMVISLYAHGMSVRDILHHLEQVYGTQLSPETISRITDRCWRRSGRGSPGRWSRYTRWCSWTPSWSRSATTTWCRTSPPTSPSASTPTARSTCWASGSPRPRPATATAGEGARFWNSVMADLRNRGVRDILIACCDGLAGFEDAICTAFPRTVVQRCVVHLVRDALRPVARRDAGEVAEELRAIYTAPTAEAAFDALAEFSASPWGRKYPRPSRVLEAAWDAFTPFLAFSPAVRKLLYTTNAIESLNYQLRKVTKARGHFPSDDAVVKLLWLAIINIEDKRDPRARRPAASRPGNAPTSPPGSSRASA